MHADAKQLVTQVCLAVGGNSEAFNSPVMAERFVEGTFESRTRDEKSFLRPNTRGQYVRVVFDGRANSEGRCRSNNFGGLRGRLEGEDLTIGFRFGLHGKIERN